MTDSTPSTAGDQVRQQLLNGVSSQLTWRYIYAYRVEYLVYTDWVMNQQDAKYDKFKAYRQKLKDLFGLNPKTATPQEFWDLSNAAHPGELYDNPFTDNEDFQTLYDEASRIIGDAYAGAPVPRKRVDELTNKLNRFRSSKPVRAIA